MPNPAFFLPILIVMLTTFTACGGGDTPTDVTPAGEAQLTDLTDPLTDGTGFNPSTIGATDSTVPSLQDTGSGFSGQFISNQTELNWTDPLTEGLVAFNIRRSLDAITDVRAGTEVYRGRDTHFSDTTPPLVDELHYRLFYEFRNGMVVASDALTLRTLTVVNDDPPSAVAGLRLSNTGDQFTMVWVNPADDDLRKINVYRNTGSPADENGTPRWILSETDEALTDTDVVSSSEYHYAFVAEDSLGQLSPVERVSSTFIDEQPPNPPTRLESIVSASSLQLSWFASTSEDVAEYQIVRHTNHFPDFDEATPTNSFSVTETIFTDGDLSQTDYYYSVFAVDAEGNASTPANILATPAVVNRPQTPSNFRLNTLINDGEIGLNWDDASSFATELRLVISTDGFINTLQDTTGLESFTLANSATSYTLTYADSAERFISLFAVDNQNVASIPAKLQSRPKDSMPPAKADSFTATAEAIGVRLNWSLPNDTDLTDVIIQWDTSASPNDIYSGQRLTKLPATNLAVVHTSATPDQTYYYALFTTDTFENVAAGGGVNASATAIAVSQQEGLLNVQAQPNDGRVDLSWAPLADTSLRVHIFNSDDPNLPLNDPAMVTQFVEGTETQFAHTDLPNGLTQHYWMFTENVITNEQSSVVNISVTPQDNLPPLQVQNVQAEPRIDSVLLSWNEDAVTDARQVIIAMSESRAPQNSADGVQVYNHEPGRNTTFAVENLNPDTLYYFSFFTLDSQNNESYGVAVFTTTTDAIPPIQPANLNASGGDNRVSLWWDSPPSSEGVSQIRIVRSESPITSVEDGVSFELSGALDAFSDTTAVNDTRYFYAVYFFDASGNQSVPAQIEATPIDTIPPNKVSNIRVGEIDNTVDLEWDNPLEGGFTQVIIRYQTGSIPVASPSGSANQIVITDTNDEDYSITGLVNDQEYTFSLFTLDDAGNYNGFESVTATPRSTAPTPPSTSFTAVAEDAQIRLNWVNPPSNYDSIHIYRSTVSYADAVDNTRHVTGSPFATGTTNFLDAGLPNGITHYYVLVNYGPNIPSTESQASAIPTDQTEPLPITGLTSVPSDQQIQFTWTDPGDADLSHVLIRRGISDFPLNELDGTEVATVTAGIQTATDSGLTNDQIYFYAFFAVDINGFYSQRVTKAEAARDTIPPAIVTGETVVNGEGQITLNWTNPTDADLKKIVIRRSTLAFPIDENSDFSAASLDDGGGAIPQTFTDTNLQNGQTYYYSLFAVDDNGNASAATTIIANPIDTTAPVSVFNLNTTALDQRVDLSWSLPPDTDFDRVRILRRDDQYPTDPSDPAATTIYEGTLTSISDTDSLVNDTTYFYRFYSLDVFDNASQADISATPVDLTPPSLVTCTSCTAGDEQVILTWSNPPEADTATLHIRRSTTAYPTTLLEGDAVASVAFPGNTYTDSGRTNLQDLYYAIFSEDNDGNVSAPYQVPVLQPQDTIAPNPVTGLVVSDTNLQIGLSWSNPADDTVNVHIRRNTGSYPATQSDGTGVSIIAISGATDVYTDSTVTPGTPYFYSLFSEDEVGNFSIAAQVSATPVDLTPPGNVTTSGIVGGDYEIDLTWANPVDADFNQVLVYRNTGSAPSATAPYLIATLTLGETSYNDSAPPLAANTQYYYRIVAEDSSGNQASGVLLNAYTDYATIADVSVEFLMEKDSGTYFCWRSANNVHFDFVEVRIQATTPPPTNASGTLIYTGVLGANTEECFEDSGLINGSAQGYTIFSVEDDGEYTSGTSFTLTPLASGELEFEGPVDFNAGSTGVAASLVHYSGRELTAANNSAADPQVNITRIDFEGEHQNNVALGSLPTTYQINDISRYSSYWYAAGYANDGNDDLNIWRYTSTVSSWYTPARYDTGAFNDNDEALNILTYSGYYFASGLREVSGNPYPVVWNLNSSGSVQASFYSGSWTVPTANAQGQVIDHIRMSDGRHILAIESTLGDSLISTSLTSTTATLYTGFDGDGELALADTEVTALARNYNSEYSVSYPIITSTVTAGGDVKIYAIDSNGTPNAAFGGDITIDETDPIRVESMVKEPDGTLHALGYVTTGGDRDIFYWRIAIDGTIEVSKRFTDGTLGSAGLEDQWPATLVLEPYTYQPIFIGTGFDGGSGYEILFGRISND